MICSVTFMKSIISKDLIHIFMKLCREFPLLVRLFFYFVVRQIKFGDKKIEQSGVRDIPCFSRCLWGGRCTKFEENQTNLKRVILPAVSSASSGDLSPDVSLTSTDVRTDVTTKARNLAFSGLSSFILSILQADASRLYLPLTVIWEVMCHWTVQVVNLKALRQKVHLG